MCGSAFLSSLLPVFFSSLFPRWVVVLKAVGCELTVAEHARLIGFVLIGLGPQLPQLLFLSFSLSFLLQV